MRIVAPACALADKQHKTLTARVALQVQALVAEHKLGAAGRKLGMAMQKELINTPERLAMEPSLSRKWVAKTGKGKQKSHVAKQTQRQTARTTSRRRLGAPESAAVYTQGASAENISEEDAVVDTSSLSDSQDKTPDASQELAVHFLDPEPADNTAEVGTQL